MRNFCNTKMKQLTEIQTIRFSKKDIELMNELKKLKIKPDQFIRISFREKVEKEIPHLIKLEEAKNKKEYCPF